MEACDLTRGDARWHDMLEHSGDVVATRPDRVTTVWLVLRYVRRREKTTTRRVSLRSQRRLGQFELR
jgi:hypothetical protein